MNISLAGKTAIVCGSSQGIGLAVAQELALLGANCILLARNETALQTALQTLSTTEAQRHQVYSIDFNNQEATAALIQQLTSARPVHILVNNSGGPAAGPITDATADQFLQAFHQHVLTAHLLTTSLLPGMKAEGYGRIVNIVSTSVKVPLKNLGVSNTTRGAMASWAKTVSNEVGRYGITVNNILPGATRTQRLESIIQATAQKKGAPIQEVEQAMLEEIPAARFGEAAEIAAVAAFLATPAAAYVNGTSIRVDGGRTGSI